MARRALTGTDEAELAWVSVYLGGSLLYLGRYAEAEDTLRDSIGLLQVPTLILSVSFEELPHGSSYHLIRASSSLLSAAHEPIYLSKPLLMCPQRMELGRHISTAAMLLAEVLAHRGKIEEARGRFYEALATLSTAYMSGGDKSSLCNRAALVATVVLEGGEGGLEEAMEADSMIQLALPGMGRTIEATRREALHDMHQGRLDRAAGTLASSINTYKLFLSRIPVWPFPILCSRQLVVPWSWPPRSSCM